MVRCGYEAKDSEVVGDGNGADWRGGLVSSESNKLR